MDETVPQSCIPFIYYPDNCWESHHSDTAVEHLHTLPKVCATRENTPTIYLYCTHTYVIYI